MEGALGLTIGPRGVTAATVVYCRCKALRLVVDRRRLRAARLMKTLAEKHSWLKDDTSGGGRSLRFVGCPQGCEVVDLAALEVMAWEADAVPVRAGLLADDKRSTSAGAAEERGTHDDSEIEERSVAVRTELLTASRVDGAPAVRSSFFDDES